MMANTFHTSLQTRKNTIAAWMPNHKGHVSTSRRRPAPGGVFLQPVVPSIRDMKKIETWSRYCLFHYMVYNADHNDKCEVFFVSPHHWISSLNNLTSTSTRSTRFSPYRLPQQDSMLRWLKQDLFLWKWSRTSSHLIFEPSNVLFSHKSE